MGDWSAQSGLQVGRELLSRPDRPTAVVAASDELALGVLAAARELGLAVPQDVSVVGIDNHEMAELYGLTTIAQPVDEQGRMATRLLLSAVAGLDAGHDVATVPISLVERSSTAPPATP
jgi:DNA-binding LacI/PurR family transcriptional regulator